ncbi:uncharacterized protein LOC141719935 [Apium graveolens]|uniref:uncharacterized protein LOC141719935 n=1 Tax=Apium graveolens TaxID=4045 RepID=UPI003D78C564
MWLKPPEDWIKMNTDVACDFRTNTMGLRCVARDEFSNFQRARGTVMYPSVQPRIAEALILREALSWIKQWRTTKCIFESDSKQLVDALNGSQANSYFNTVVSDCIELIKHFDEVLVIFTYRSANNVAHVLSRVVCSMSYYKQLLDDSLEDPIGRPAVEAPPVSSGEDEELSNEDPQA